jgi:hypothetical protein
VSAQLLNDADYVVFEFVHRHHGIIPPHLGKFTGKYYWIVRVDSINTESTFTIHPLIVNSETQIQVDYCLDGHTVDFFGLYEGASDKYVAQIDTFKNIVRNNRRKLQTITMQWYEEKIRKREKVDIYAIPIKGTFCRCLQRYYNKAKNSSIERIYIPISDFRYNNEFWNTNEWNIVKYVDYSYVNFAAFTPWGIQYRTGSLVKMQDASHDMY